MSYLFDSLSILFPGFVPTILLLLLLRLLNRERRWLWDRLTYCANTLLLIASCLFTLYYLATLIPALWESADHSAFKWRVPGPYGYAYWIMMLCYVVPQILWIRKYRSSIRCAALLALFMSLPFFTERIIIYLTTIYRDYRPSSWTYYAPQFSAIAFSMGCYGLLLALTYAILYRKQWKRPAQQ